MPKNTKPTTQSAEATASDDSTKAKKPSARSIKTTKATTEKSTKSKKTSTKDPARVTSESSSTKTTSKNSSTKDSPKTTAKNTSAKKSSKTTSKTPSSKTAKTTKSSKSASTKAASVTAEASVSAMSADTPVFQKAKKPEKSKKTTPKNITPTAVKPPKAHRKLYITAIILSCLAILCSTGTVGLFIYNEFFRSATPLTVHYDGKDGNSTNFTDNSIAAVANTVSPAVVSILTETRYQSWTGQSTSSSSAGTGMIISADGYVLTNKHVVDGANSISVQTDDGETHTDVKVVGIDPLNDAAFLKIPDVSELPTVKLGSSKTIVHGQPVVAIGNALGQFQNSVTEGIVSGTGRSIIASDSNGEAYERLTDLIQTDAAINPGNSGGPLVNAAGEVIGINTAVSSSANGISFAIPISSIKGMLQSIMEDNKADRAYIGAYYVTITPSVAKSNELPVKYGAYLHHDGQSAIINNSPAEKAGLKDDDIITAINGEKLDNYSLTSILGEYKAGDTVQLTVTNKDGKEKLTNITLGAYPTTTDEDTQEQ